MKLKLNYSILPTLVFSGILSSVCLGYSPVPPEEKFYQSESGKYRLIITPAKLDNSWAYDSLMEGYYAELFRGKKRVKREDLIAWMALHENVSSPGKNDILWERPAAVPIQPLAAFVSEYGHVLTLGSWPGDIDENALVVALYDVSGRLTGAWKLKDIFDPTQLKAIKDKSTRLWWDTVTISRREKSVEKDLFHPNGIIMELVFEIQISSNLDASVFPRAVTVVANGSDSGKIDRRTPGSE